MSAFAEHAAALTLLAGADPLPALLARRQPGPWRRTFARFHPRRPAYCTLLYEPEGDAWPLCVSLFRERGGAAPADSVDVPGLGVAQIGSPLAEPALTTLPALLAQHGDARIVRWRPHRRCTLRASHASAGSQFVKVFLDGDTAVALDGAMQALWRHRGELDFLLAEPLGADRALHCTRQAALPGASLVPELFGTRGLEVAVAMGRAAATLPHCSLREAAADDTLERSRRNVQEITQLIPEHGARVGALLQHLNTAEADCPPSRALPIHGGLHPSQWLRVDERLGLIDFDRLTIGDPELDVATFVTELRHEKSTAVPAAALCDAFVAGYAERVALQPKRLALYAAHKEVAKLSRLARAPRPDAPRRFERALSALEARLRGA